MGPLVWETDLKSVASGFDPHHMYVLYSPMVRISDFHSDDPGSIPGIGEISDSKWDTNCRCIGRFDSFMNQPNFRIYKIGGSLIT